MLVTCLLVFAVYLVVANWTLWLQGSSVVPLVLGLVASFAAWPALGWPLALLALVVDPGCLLYALLVIRLHREAFRGDSSW